MSEEAPEGLRQPVFPKSILGRVIQHVHVPRVSYETYAAAQEIVRGRFRRKTRWTEMLRETIAGLIVTACIFGLIKIYNLPDISPVLFCLILYLTFTAYSALRYRKLIDRKIFESGLYDDVTIFFGEKGILLVSKIYVQFFAWKMVESVTKSKTGILIVTQSYVLAIIPESHLGLIPDRDAILAFVEERIGNAANTKGSSRSGKG
jgi:uncharacterized membrane protein YhaH (DUF805 family)